MASRWIGGVVAVALVMVVATDVTVGPPVAAAATQGTLVVDYHPRANGAVAVVGDSLTYAYFDLLDDEFRAAQWGPFALEARSTRRTTVTLDSATSGLDAVRRIRAEALEPAVWVIALGTNDLRTTARIPGATAALIDTMMAELGPGARVVWVNVYSRDDPVETAAFNAELVAATLRFPLLSVADWYSVAAVHPEWFHADGVHNNDPGSFARNHFLAAAALVRPCTASAPSVAPPPAAVGQVQAAAATAVAQRLCVVR